MNQLVLGDAVELGALLEAVDAASGVGFALVDREGSLLCASPSLGGLLGGGWAVGKPLAGLVDEGDAAAVERIFSNGSPHGRRERVALGRKGAAGAPELQLVPLAGDGGRWLVSVRDASARQRIEKHLTQSERLRVLGEMTLGLAHELNNLLSAIQGATELGGSSSHDTEIVRRAADDAAGIIRRVQQFARPRAEHEEHRAVDVVSLVRDALDFTRTRWQTQAYLRGIEIPVDLDLQDPGLVRGAGADLREVFVNLILNAVDAMPDGGTLRISTQVEDGLATIRFEDTGVGIGPEAREHLFEPFFSTKGSHGLGLGLSIVASIVGAHGGSISVDSAPAQGARFTVQLPLAGSETRVETGRDASARRAPVQPARILVVEDNEPLRAMLEKILRRDGHEVTATASAEDAQRCWLENGACDVVVTDLSLPGCSGLELARWLQGQSAPPRTLLITAWGIELESHTLERYGIHALLSKPFRFEELRRRICELQASPALA